MNYILSPHEQGTPEWKADRAGKATGSKAKCIKAKGKGGDEAVTRRDYRVQLVAERLNGAPADDIFINAEMQHGTETEPLARMAYEARGGFMVQEAGFAYHPTILAGCSVDGFVDDGGRQGIIEIKCPKTATHLSYLLAKRLPTDYEPQILHNMWITGAQFCDFISFDNRLPEKYRMFVIRVERDDGKINDYVAECMSFLADVESTIKQLEAL